MIWRILKQARPAELVGDAIGLGSIAAILVIGLVLGHGLGL